jgi:putative restriction endonuclease
VEEDGLEDRLRTSMFAYLRLRGLVTGGPVTYDDLAGFEFEGQRIPLMDRQRGIRKPKFLNTALSFRTVHRVRPDQLPYDDAPGPEGFLRYKWQGTDGSASPNRALRNAMDQSLPLVWFQGFESGLYHPVFPVYLVAEEPDLHQFVVALDEEQVEDWAMGAAVPLSTRRAYAQRSVRQRLHQPLFRSRILTAYEGRCTVCRLRHVELLDAAHIQSDGDGGEPVVTNGMAMCKIHHAAYDANMLGVDRDYRVHIRPDLLKEKDGPTLRHALQELHHSSLVLPARRAAHPDRLLLTDRFERFLAAS